MTNKGEEGMHWFRTFYFPKKERHFDADMIIDQKSHKVLDYFGKPRLLMSELHFTVTKHGFLRIQSGRQKLLMLGREWPACLHGFTVCQMSQKATTSTRVCIPLMCM